MASTEPHLSSSFSPKTSPRPEYPPFAQVAPRWAWVHIRDMILGVAICTVLYPAYIAASAHFSERVFFSLAVCAAHSGTYILFNGTLYALEQLRFTPLLRCAIGRKPIERPSYALVKQLVTEAVINHLVTTPLATYMMYPLASGVFGMPSPAAPLPSLLHMAGLFAGAHTFNDFTFYWTHRLFHTKLLYSRFHKQHHAFRGSVGAAAEFAGAVEVIISNQIPTLGFLLGAGAHPLVQAAWLILRLTQTYEVHSGFDFSETWLGKLGITANETAHHDHHHTVNMGNFGAEHTDWLFGTMDHYVQVGERQGYIAKRAHLDRTDAAKKAK